MTNHQFEKFEKLNAERLKNVRKSLEQAKVAIQTKNAWGSVIKLSDKDLKDFFRREAEETQHN